MENEHGILWEELKMLRKELCHLKSLIIGGDNPGSGLIGKMAKLEETAKWQTKLIILVLTAIVGTFLAVVLR